MGNSAVTIAGILKADGLNSVSQVGFRLHPLRTSRLWLVVETAPCQLHQSAPPADIHDDVFEKGNDFPFLCDWLRLYWSPFFRNSFSRVNFPTRRSSFSILSLRAPSSVGSLLNLPRLYCFFQW